MILSLIIFSILIAIIACAGAVIFRQRKTLDWWEE